MRAGAQQVPINRDVSKSARCPCNAKLNVKGDWQSRKESRGVCTTFWGVLASGLQLGASLGLEPCGANFNHHSPPIESDRGRLLVKIVSSAVFGCAWLCLAFVTSYALVRFENHLVGIVVML